MIDVAALLQSIPYCAWLGVSARIEDNAVVLDLPFDAKLVGNPILPALHGGVTGSLLETAAIAQILWETGGRTIPRSVDITIDYLRSAGPLTTHARAHIVRQGRRVISARADMWQDDPARPVASFRGHFLLTSGE
jgi:uncharacterized protein (TIGR00369 family)